jgi:hypothetical protein
LHLKKKIVFMRLSMDVIICTSVDGTFLEKFAFKGTISTVVC